MPVMDGFEAARAIRGIGTDYTAHVPIIALSADAYDKIENQCFDAGMNASLVKPVNSRELYRTLVKAILKPEERKTEKLT